MKQLSKRVLSRLPMAIKQGRPYRQQMAFLRRAEHWGPEATRAWQSLRLREIVRHAWQNCEGYRDLYDKAGITPDDIHSVDDLRYLPTVTKQMMQGDVEAFSVPLKGRRYTTTGGSTGIPFGFYLTPQNRAIELAYQHTAWQWTGWRPSYRSVVLRGGFVGTKSQPWAYDAYRQRLDVTASYLTPEALPEFLYVLHRCYRPQTLQAYPSACLLLADLLIGYYSMPVDLPFRWIMLGSENLYDWQIEKLTRAFPQGRLVSWYGHSEKAVLAPWCEHSRTFHCWPFYGYTEVLDDQGQETSEGKEGQVVATSFHMSATPFIRYETMDRAVKGPPYCSDCGRNFQTLTRIEGRMQEVIVSETGRYISMTALNMHSRVFDPLKQFQFMQQEPGHVVFRFVPKGLFLTRAESRRVRNELQDKLGDDVSLSLERVLEIPYTRSGKLCFLEQRLPIRYGEHDE